MKNLKNILGILLIGFLLASCEEKQKTPRVQLLEENGQYTLTLDGNPFYLNGAGLEFGNMESLKAHGGNSFRTWRVNNGEKTGKEVLDEAQKHGLMVCMGIEIARERHGFDYNDEAAVQEQFNRVKAEVMELKDHPALLMWGIGNELNLHYENDKVWTAVNDISKMIHEVDGNHPTTTMLAGAWPELLNKIETMAPDLDLLSFQLYGDIVNLPKYLKDSDYKGAYTVSEWGATGHWEVAKTSWGRPVEHNSTLKAKDYMDRYQKVIASDPKQCIGSFVFLWGQKQERTPTWYGVFLEDGSETEAVEVMEYMWTGEWSANRTPQLSSFTIDGKNAYESVILIDGQSYTAKAEITDPENDPLNYKWQIIEEVPNDQKSDGGDFEKSQEILLDTVTTEKEAILEFKAPSKGEYRLFVYAYDGTGNAVTANIPILIEK
jgi:hypothetical protein